MPEQTRIDICPDCGETVVTVGQDTLDHTCEPEVPDCAGCGSGAFVFVVLGVLGNTLHLRCRACGLDTAVAL